MSKRILLLSSLYPSDDVHFKNNTAVCHYFAKDWMSMGYEVRVINLYHEYPRFFYPILKITQNILADKVPTAILAERKHDEYTYVMDGIKVTRLPVYKRKPHGDFEEAVIKKVSERIYEIIQDEDFIPDYILGHFLLPGIRIVTALTEKYPNAISAIALHGKESIIKQSVRECLPKIDYIGYRCYPIKNSFEKLYGVNPFFMCMSGVPETYITEDVRTFENGIHKYIYVGNFMKRKYPSVLIPAIAANYKDKDFKITYVGDGNGRKSIEQEMKKCDVRENIIFTGRIPRTEVTREMDEADVFIMISEAETFGLVHLEAMARGCITVASRDEGMDGVIVDGENGFLCKAGDKSELYEIVKKIKSMEPSALQMMSAKAIATAKSMTDSEMAKKYIESIIAEK